MRVKNPRRTFYFVSKKRDQRTLLKDQLTLHMLYFLQLTYLIFFFLIFFFYVGLVENVGIFESAQNANMSSMTSARYFFFSSFWERLVHNEMCVCSRRAIVKVFLSGTNSAHHMISTVEWLSCVFPWMPCGSNI